MLRCERIQRIPLNCIDRICHGEFTFPQKSLNKIVFIVDRQNSVDALSHVQVPPEAYPTSHESRDAWCEGRYQKQSRWVVTAVAIRREGEGLRIIWDRLREPTFLSRWNPFSGDFPFCTFTKHPVLEANDKFTKMCALDQFMDQLTQAVQRAHEKKPIPGNANRVPVLKHPILIETYVGLMSFIGNQNKLGFCLARGNMGF
ncbi:TPRGL protein, partial [Polyodon spathula]|nr:TPRGL protein [Polyodon spathula]